jgi:hypothetical protein
MLTVRIKPKINENPLATMKYSAASVRPFNTIVKASCDVTGVKDSSPPSRPNSGTCRESSRGGDRDY